MNRKTTKKSRISRTKERTACYQTRYTSIVRKLFEISKISNTKFMFATFDESRTPNVFLSEGDKVDEFLLQYLNFQGTTLNFTNGSYKLLKNKDDSEIYNMCRIQKNNRKQESSEKISQLEVRTQTNQNSVVKASRKLEEQKKNSDYEILADLEKNNSFGELDG